MVDVSDLPIDAIENVLCFLTPYDIIRFRRMNARAKSLVDGTVYGRFLQLTQFEKSRANLDVHAAALGCVRVLDWLSVVSAHGFFRKELFEAGARNGRMCVMRWLFENECPWDHKTCAEAARRGHIDALAWVVSRGCPLTTGVFEEAVSASMFEVMDWLHTSKCPWDTGSCKRAAMNGDLRALRWLRERACPWNGDVLFESCRAGHDEVFAWAVANGCPDDELVTRGITEATADGDLKFVTKLYEHGRFALRHEIQA